MKEEIIQSDAAQVENKRNYSFLAKNEDTLDVVEDGEQSFVVPAQPGSCYWAILKIGYENHDRPIRRNDFIDQIAQMLQDRDPEKWQRFVNKDKVKTFRNKQVVEKEATDWRARIETNIKTMCRHSGSNPYGQRLCERGHILRWEADAFDGEGGYCLRTDTNQPLIRRQRGRKDSSVTSS